MRTPYALAIRSAHQSTPLQSETAVRFIDTPILALWTLPSPPGLKLSCPTQVTKTRSRRCGLPMKRPGQDPRRVRDRQTAPRRPTIPGLPLSYSRLDSVGMIGVLGTRSGYREERSIAWALRSALLPLCLPRRQYTKSLSTDWLSPRRRGNPVREAGDEEARRSAIECSGMFSVCDMRSEEASGATCRLGNMLRHLCPIQRH